MPKLVNKRHEKFVRGIMEGKEKVEAYKLAFPKANANSARDRATKLLRKKPELRQRLSELLEMQGLGIVDLNEKLYNLTTATKTIFIDKQAFEVPDNATRMESVKTGYKLHNFLQSAQPNIDARSINLNINAESAEKLKNITEKLSRISENLLKPENYQTGEITDIEVFRGQKKTADV